jgi:DHA1 family multidrug resistance protein-like MFS transporter
MFVGSPSLSTSPASFTDMLTLNKLPYVLAIWSASGMYCSSHNLFTANFSIVAATMAPALGPITVGYALQVKDWHWSMFELLWLAAPIFVFLFFLLPETSADNILLRRAARLRALTGNPNFKSQSEIVQANLSIKEVLFDALIKPWEMNILDPAILFSTGYVALCYAIFYSFFEAFPLVFSGMHGFSLGSSGLTFLAIPVALVIAIPLQLLHFAYRLEPFIMRHGTPVAEFWLENSLFVSVFAPIGLFIFGL